MRAIAASRGLAQLTLIVMTVAIPCQGARLRDRDDSDVRTPLPQTPAWPGDSESAGWLSGDWAYRVRITVPPDSIQGAGDLCNFTLLLPLDAEVLPGVFAHSNPDGSDLIVAGRDGVTLQMRDLVTYDALAGSAEFWFKADTLSRQANVFYLYYGNPDTSIAPAGGLAWDRDYLGVYHFEGDPGSGVLADHGQHGNDALPMNGWTSSDTTAGVIGQAWRLDGTHHWLDGDALASADSSSTISAWLEISNPLSSGTDFAFQTQTGHWHLSAKTNSQNPYPDIATPQGFIRWNCDPQPDDQLHHFVWLMDGVQDTARFFFDGEEQPVRLRYAPNAPHKVYTGAPIGGNVGVVSPYYFNDQDLFCGTVDEYRTFRGVRSPEWIQTEYRNQRSGSAFFEFGEEQSSGIPQPGPGARDLAALRVYPNPSGMGNAIRFRIDAPGDGRLEILDLAGRLIRTFGFTTTDNGIVRESWDARGKGDALLPGGVYIVRSVSGDRVREGRFVLVR
jgi:hypothetical protein